VSAEPREETPLRFLERADLALSALDEPRKVFERLAAVLVPELADLCAVWIADGGPPRALAVRHADPRLEALAARLLERHPLAASDALGRALDGAEPLLCERIDPAVLAELAQDPAEEALLAELAPRSAVLVPLRFGDGARGLVVLASGGERGLGPIERSLLGILARRVAAAYEVDRLRAEDRRTTGYFQVLSEAGRLFAESLDLQATLDAFVRLSVPALADAVALNIVDADGVTRTAALDARDAAHRSLLAALRDAYVVERTPRRAARLFVHDERAHHEVSWIAPDRLPVLQELGYRSSLVVPLVSHGVVRGDLVCHWAHQSRAFDGFTLELFEELARRAAVALENAQMYRREKRIADEVQQALLPTALPQVPGYAFDAVYSPSERDVEVGGDWFDAFALPDGRVAISIGDVFGHGLHAAVVMSSIRHGLRVLALQQSQPDRMLQVVDDALARDYPDASASAVVAVLDPSAQTLTYAVAGHPSPLLRTPDGEVHALRGNGVPLGVRGAVTPNVQTVALPLGAMLVLYTDGLVEATRGDALDAEQRVSGALRDEELVRDPHPAERIKRCVLERGGADDVAVLTVRVRSSIPRRDPSALAPQWVFRADDARSAEDARAGFIAFLKTRGVPDANYAAAELVFGELVGNVVRHAPGPITIELDWEKDDPVLHVIDRGRAFDVHAALPEDVMSESGRGLFLVSVLTDDFAVTSLPDYGNHTRVKLRIERLEEIASDTPATSA
jgi:GAF domain-containing protein